MKEKATVYLAGCSPKIFIGDHVTLATHESMPIMDVRVDGLAVLSFHISVFQYVEWEDTEND